MAQIYSNAYITILASNAGDAAHGFLAHRDALDASSARIPFRIAPNRFGSITARRYAHRSPSVKLDNPLSTRAWALQEQVMASRTLAYTKHTLEWRCATSMMSLNDSLNLNLGFDPVPKLISQLSTNPEEALFEWSRILADYSGRSMSVHSDKLPAIAALVERFAAVLGDYYAGLWRYDLIRQLCWMLDYPPQKQRAGNPYRAPSWSWASIDEVITWHEDRGEACCNLVSAVVLPKNAQILYGEVAYASIKICGRVLIASVPSAIEDDDGRCTVFHHESEVAESPLQRFYKTYFHLDTKGAVSSRALASEMLHSWDYKEFRSDPSIVREFPPPLTTLGKQL